jgi:hypothetical protein
VSLFECREDARHWGKAYGGRADHYCILHIDSAYYAAAHGVSLRLDRAERARGCPPDLGGCPDADNEKYGELAVRLVTIGA